MWHPALALVHDVAPVRVHGSLTSRRPLVVELPDLTALVPVGRLRRTEPDRYVLQLRVDRTPADDALLVVPDGAVLPPPHPWWRQPAAFLALGVLLGVVLALVVGTGPVAFAQFVAGAAAVVVNVWAFAGSDAGS